MCVVKIKVIHCTYTTSSSTNTKLATAVVVVVLLVVVVVPLQPVTVRTVALYSR